MTHNENTNVVTEAMQAVLENGLEGMGAAFAVLLNEAMKIERSEFIRAQPWERTEHRKGYANGFKPKRLSTRLEKLDLKILQVRGDEGFYTLQLLSKVNAVSGLENWPWQKCIFREYLREG